MSLPPPCHCEERSDAAIPSRGAHVPRLLRFARNDSMPDPHRQPPPCHYPCHVIAGSAATRQSRDAEHMCRDCFASLAMTVCLTRTGSPHLVITPAMSLRGAQRRGNLEMRARWSRLLRFARNDNMPGPHWRPLLCSSSSNLAGGAAGVRRGGGGGSLLLRRSQRSRTDAGRSRGQSAPAEDGRKRREAHRRSPTG